MGPVMLILAGSWLIKRCRQSLSMAAMLIRGKFAIGIDGVTGCEEGGLSGLETGVAFLSNYLTISVKYCKKRGRSEVRDDSHLRSVMNFSRKFLMRVKGSRVFRTSLSVIFLKSKVWAGSWFMTDVKMLPQVFAVERESNIFL